MLIYVYNQNKTLKNKKRLEDANMTLSLVIACASAIALTLFSAMCITSTIAGPERALSKINPIAIYLITATILLVGLVTKIDSIMTHIDSLGIF